MISEGEEVHISYNALEGSVSVACGHGCRPCYVGVPNEGVVWEPGGKGSKKSVYVCVCVLYESLSLKVKELFLTLSLLLSIFFCRALSHYYAPVSLLEDT